MYFFLLLQWNYDYHSATYLLLLQKKLRGRPIRLVASKTKKIARPLFEQPQPLTPYRVSVCHVASQIHCTNHCWCCITDIYKVLSYLSNAIVMMLVSIDYLSQ